MAIVTYVSESTIIKDNVKCIVLSIDKHFLETLVFPVLVLTHLQCLPP